MKKSMSARLEKAIVVGLIAVVVFTAMAHGAVESWSVAIFESLALAIMMMWAVKSVIDKRILIIAPKAALPLAAFVALGAAQSIALGSGAARWSLSMDIEATRAATLTIFFLLVLFLMSASFFASRERLRLLASFLVVYGLALALFALAQHFTWNGRLYWLRPNTQGGTPFGPFVNRNHFAGYLEMLIPVSVGLAITRSARAEARVFYGFAAAVMGLAVVASLSRGGMMALAASMAFVAAMRMMRKRAGAGVEDEREEQSFASSRLSSFSFIFHPSVLILFIVVSIAAGIIWIGPDPVINRIAESRVIDSDSGEQVFRAGREQIWRDTLAMIQARPLFGVGIGAYETAYPIYSKTDGSLVIAEAHNDYLQVLADSGIAGGALALLFLALVLRTVAWGTRSRDPLLAGLALGSGGGIFAMLAHSLFDFNLQLPSNALLFLILCAVASRVGVLAAESVAGASLRTSH